MTDEKFKEIACKILNNEEVSQFELTKLVFYKVEHYQKYYDVLGCALYQLGVYNVETMRWTDYLQYEHLPIISKIENKIENRLDYLEENQKLKVSLNFEEANVLAYAMTVYKSVLHTLHRDKIKEDLKTILNAMVEKRKEVEEDE